MTQDEREVETRLHLVENENGSEGLSMEDEFLQKISEMEEFLIEEVATALLKRWFPKRLPVGDDFEKWTEIALADSTAVVKHLIEKQILLVEAVTGVEPTQSS
jgi:acetyl/propionyl-CoA carboxylase alpha subunit